jgi:SAM-dependent methyltransferase
MDTRLSIPIGAGRRLGKTLRVKESCRVQPYTEQYYEAHRGGARQSARVLVPLVLRYFRPSSVLDVGCGQGTWLAVFREHGIKDVWGVDGEYVDRARLEIPPERFLAWDLTRRLLFERRFDLVMSLEVAEHLPAECADQFVDSLTRLGPLVLFSAAAPHQGGANHVNEQWPAYWAQRFHARGYEPVDCLRRRIWQDERVAWWYAQNTILYADTASLERHPLLKQEYEFAGGMALPLVHPKRFLEWVEWSLRLCAQTGPPPGSGSTERLQ